MSTKIYEAYRTKKRGINLLSLVEKIHKVLTPILKKEMWHKYNEWLSFPVKDQMEMWNSAYPDKPRHSLMDRLDMSQVLRTLYTNQIASDQRSYFDLNYCVTVREHGGRYYFIVHAGDFWSSGALTALGKIKDLEFYGYWNNTDRPKGTTAREWSNRKKVWDLFYKNNKWNYNYLTIDVMNTNRFLVIDPAWDPAFNKKFSKNEISKII